MEQYADKAIWALTGMRQAKAEYYVMNFTHFCCSYTLLGKLSKMEICAQPNNCLKFSLFCLTVSKETKLTY